MPIAAFAIVGLSSNDAGCDGLARSPNETSPRNLASGACDSHIRLFTLQGGACPWTERASPGSLDERAVMSNVVRLRDLRGRTVSDMRGAAANYERVEGSTSVRCVSEWVMSTLSRQSSSADRAAATRREYSKPHLVLAERESHEARLRCGCVTPSLRIWLIVLA